MVKPEYAKVGQKLKIDILGKMHEVSIIENSPYDSENKLLRNKKLILIGLLLALPKIVFAKSFH